MNTISNIGQSLAKEGHINYNPNPASAQKIQQPEVFSGGAAKVVDTIAQNNASVKEDVQQLQRLSDMVMGRKLQFNVNNELGSVIIKIVDPNTDKVIKEIPSADIQKLKIRIRKAIGLLFDQMI